MTSSMGKTRIFEKSGFFSKDCQRVKMQLVQALGIEDFELWACPEQYRHLLHDERRQELNKRVKTIY